MEKQDKDEKNDNLSKEGEPKSLSDELHRCEEDKKSYLEGWQRSKADYINYKNDEGRRLEDMARFITAGLIQEILPVLDSFDLAVGHGLSPEIEKGILLIKAQFEDILKKRGLATIKIERGEEFNPEKHEGIGEVESSQPPGTITEEIQKGYLFRGKVLRPARVKIAKQNDSSASKLVGT